MAIPVIAENEVLVGKSSRSEVCGMEINASLIKAVTSTLYDFKKEAVVREYSTNITDSHNDSGNTGLAGFVKIPTELNPNIEFHDYGLGMYENTLYSIYTVLGLSTKREDNNTNGSLGLGSSSFCAVSDQMTVTSVKDGEKVLVVVYRDKNGMISADTKSVTKTSEGNGTVVSIPVKLNEVREWQKTAALVLGAFKVKHNTNGFGDFQYLYEEMSEVCDKCRTEGSVFLSKTSLLQHHRSSSLVLMGDVAYHLPNSDSLLRCNQSSVLRQANKIFSEGFYMTSFNIGDLDHAPSRETISYDEQTLRKVTHRANKDIINYYREVFKPEIENTSYYKFYHKHSNTPLWETVKDMCLPFTQGVRLYQTNPKYTDYRGVFQGIKIKPMNNMGFVVKGLIPSASGYSTVYKGDLSESSQVQVVGIKNPKILYKTENVQEHKISELVSSFGRDTLYVSEEEHADVLLDWFGCGEKICCDDIMPKKVKSVRTSSRESFGIKEDFETVGIVHNFQENDRYNSKQDKVDLSEEGVYYIPLDKSLIEMSGFVKGQTTKLHGLSYRVVELLQAAGIKKLIVENKNNTGKIQRSGVKCINTVLLEYLKPFKKEMIKGIVWGEHQVKVDSYDRPLLVASKTNKLYSNKIVDTTNVKHIIDVSGFGLSNTKLYKQELERKRNLELKIEDEVDTLKKMLPLWDLVKYKDDVQIEYYLRLEKFIK